MSWARECATELATVLEPAGMTLALGGDRKHVRIEGWQTLGALTGYTARVAWAREYETDRGTGWEARAEVVDRTGQVVGAGEGMCLRSEKRWAKAEEYAVRSMAQTRAQSRALASVLRHIVVLAGFEGTPAEEMPAEPAPAQRSSRRPTLHAERWKTVKAAAAEAHIDLEVLKGRLKADHGLTSPKDLADDAKYAAILAELQGSGVVDAEAEEMPEQHQPHESDELPF